MNELTSIQKVNNSPFYYRQNNQNRSSGIQVKKVQMNKGNLLWSQDNISLPREIHAPSKQKGSGNGILMNKM